MADGWGRVGSRNALERKYPDSTAEWRWQWIFPQESIFFHHVRHPAEMDEPGINAFLTNLAVKEQVSASTQDQALSATLFLGSRLVGIGVSAS